MTDTLLSRHLTCHFVGETPKVACCTTLTVARAYTSADYRDELRKHGITCSMSRRGNCIDNATMESWNSTLKSELGERFQSHADAREKLFEYIEVFYNQVRLHSSLGYTSPAEFERRVAS
jgi:putative transposase